MYDASYTNSEGGDVFDSEDRIDDEILDDLMHEHNRDDDGGRQNHRKGSKEREKATKLKTAEILMAAVYTLISAGLSVIKFINQIAKLKPKEEEQQNYY